MEKKTYVLNDTSNIVSPALVYYRDIILANTKRTIETAGNADRLWPHVKSHKTAEMVRMQIDMGITRFKCATIAEAEMTAKAGGALQALHIILAYPLVGPNISRFARLVSNYSQAVFYAIGDDLQQLGALSDEAGKTNIKINVLVDVDVGMHRTGVPMDRLEKFYESACAFKNITLKGLHCYDGHLHDSDINVRKSKVEEIDREVLKIQEALLRKGLDCGLLVMGGTPTFPCRAKKANMYLSPGTCFIGDWGYYKKFSDMAYTPGAAVFSRVVSHTAENTFTIDLGSKGIASDPAGERGIIAGMEEAKPLFQSEEHWVFSLPGGQKLPAIGSECYVIPTHICPTSALYPHILIARDGKIIEEWQVSARNRRINF
ncbi:MAG: D-TA family PLP-dependent enzyme [Treponema sp.]|jgi:D-serine deaminase-like pyridoxal phosphate-dependent protein|nr:D-TA family PLP-dependent enzyme [Treponema sp.]